MTMSRTREAARRRNMAGQIYASILHMRRILFPIALALAPVAGSHAQQAAPPASPSQSPAIRALYVNRWASQSKRRMAKLLAEADETEINALVIDMKDEFGLNYKSEN